MAVDDSKPIFPATAARPRLRWFQYRLRTLMVLMVLVAVGVRWASNPIIKVRQQAAAVKTIAAAGGRTYCGEKPTLTGWLRIIYAPDLENSISHVEFSETSGDVEFAQIEFLPDLLHMIRCGTRVTDAGLEHLSGLTELESLDLSHTQITGRGLEYSERLTNLKVLNLSHTLMSDENMQFLVGLVNLEILDLSHTKINGSGFHFLARLAHLEILQLTATPTTDADLQQLTRLQSIETLDLMDTQITDAGLVQLASMNQLRHLALEGTNVTDEGVERLKSALPNCKIDSELHKL